MPQSAHQTKGVPATGSGAAAAPTTSSTAASGPEA
eukprot:CAMPEP_0180716762 /NCGR_PEP_ID=MMETSP1038_2-20121128/13623_1 /TAXON_ID=632150 /ORGANISM="Azadinium spinosum, Strain 3D9" /LENGTH=34 /DNA_ID= /DNA_START= /DNA_END= /DNA_ORIENTATION=